jgi:hypothetical protein
MYKLREGDCIYLIDLIGDDPTIASSMLKIKVGLASNINSRISTYMTSNPYCKLLYVMYTPKNKILEAVVMIQKYETKLLLDNREIIIGVSVEDLIESLLSVASPSSLNIKYTVETQSEMDKFNDIVTHKYMSDNDDEHTPKGVTRKRCKKVRVWTFKKCDLCRKIKKLGAFRYKNISDEFSCAQTVGVRRKNLLKTTLYPKKAIRMSNFIYFI